MSSLLSFFLKLQTNSTHKRVENSSKICEKKFESVQVCYLQHPLIMSTYTFHIIVVHDQHKDHSWYYNMIQSEHHPSLMFQQSPTPRCDSEKLHIFVTESVLPSDSVLIYHTGLVPPQ